jgi:hypothetical protein
MNTLLFRRTEGHTENLRLWVKFRHLGSAKLKPASGSAKCFTDQNFENIFGHSVDNKATERWRHEVVSPGVDVMITIFPKRFFPIFGEKIGVFLKYQCYDQFFSKFGFVLSKKRQFFC